MRQVRWNNRYGFTASETVKTDDPNKRVNEGDNFKAFMSDTGHAKLWERLEETKERLPWVRKLVDSLQSQVRRKGVLSDKQRSLATSMYIDACATSDDRLAAQVATRKLCYRLMDLELGRVAPFVHSVLTGTDTRPFTIAQASAVEKIATRQRVKLTQVPKLTDENFDGWLKITPPIGVDNDCG